MIKYYVLTTVLLKTMILNYQLSLMCGVLFIVNRQKDVSKLPIQNIL